MEFDHNEYGLIDDGSTTEVTMIELGRKYPFSTWLHMEMLDALAMPETAHAIDRDILARFDDEA